MAQKREIRQSPLSSINRHITTHDDKTGLAVFENFIAAELPTQVVPDAVFRQAYVTKGFPPSLNNFKDLQIYNGFLEDAPGLTVSGGTVLRYVDMPPNTVSPMHRTVSLDYGIVIEGEVELVLDSGEIRHMKRGDSAIQRGTMHAWKNPHSTEWARMVFILQPCEPVVVAGESLKEDYGDMQDVKRSQ